MVGVLKTNTNFERMIVYFVRLYVETDLTYTLGTSHV